jgi:Spy/CpxP family protein refolding chaperone
MKIVTALLILLTAATITLAQDPTLVPGQPGQPDSIEQLRLTPDQRQAIRRIVAENRDERQSTNQRVREANIALDQALDADPPDENLIEQRINELAAAQAAQLRMRIHTEIKIRRILRPEQIATLRRLRLQVRDVMNSQRRNRLPSNQTLRPRP